ncbi:MAG: DUF1573 domain-containing protein [Kiritimatiellia bacterium]
MSSPMLLKSLFVLTLLWLSMSLLRAQPVIFCEQAVVDFGEKPSGTVVEHVFLIENRGDDVLKISEIRSTCGCTTPGEKTMVILAGEQKELRVVMDLKGRSGPQNQQVTLFTNDPEQRSFDLRISGEAVPEIRVEPRTLNLKQVGGDRPHEGEILLTSTKGEPFKITSVKASRDRVRASLKMAEDGKSAKILVQPRSQKGQGHFTDVLVIETDHPEVREVRVLVMWQVSTGVTVAPGQMSLVLRDNSPRLDRYLMVRGYPGMSEPLEVTGVEWPGQEVEIAFADTEKFGWRIHFKSFEPQASMDGGEILIHTNAEGFETLRIPVRVLKK